MTTFVFNASSSALDDPGQITSGVDFSGKSMKLATAKDAQPIVDAINSCPSLQHLSLAGNTLCVAAAVVIATALESHPELKVARFANMFSKQMENELPPALSALGEGMTKAGARLRSLDVSDNAFGLIRLSVLARLLESDVCGELEELRLHNCGLGIFESRILASALSAHPAKLKIIIGGRNSLEKDGAAALAEVFQDMGRLVEHTLLQNGIYHVGIGALPEAFKQNPPPSRTLRTALPDTEKDRIKYLYRNMAQVANEFPLESQIEIMRDLLSSVRREKESLRAEQHSDPSLLAASSSAAPPSGPLGEN